MKLITCLFTLLLVALFAAPALADRTPSRRIVNLPNPGARGDITVPYLTSGNSAFIANGVAPRVYTSPVLKDAAGPGTRPTYNLPFYGARMGFGGGNNGAVEKPTLLP